MDDPNPAAGPRETRTSEPRERISSFEQMKVWQEAHAMVLRIFEITPRLPAEQQDALALMLEKAAIEVPKSIAEGFKRRGSRNKAHFYNVAQSALESLRYLMILARDLKFDVDYDDLAYRGDQVSRMLDGLVRSMSRGGSGGGGSGGRRGRGGRGRGRRHRDDIGEGPSAADGDENEHWDDEV